LIGDRRPDFPILSGHEIHPGCGMISAGIFRGLVSGISFAACKFQRHAGNPQNPVMKTLSNTLLLWTLACGAGQAFPIPLPSPVPANETPFANLQPGQYAVLKNITTNNPANDHKACAIRLSQKFDKSGQAAVIYVIKEDILPPTDGQWNWIDKYNIVLVNLGLWDNQPFYTEGYDEADIMIDNGIIPMMQGARYLVEKYYHPDPEKFYVSGWSVGGDLFTLMTTRPEWRGVIKGLIGTPGVAIVSGDPTSVPIAERGWVKYFNGCGTLDGAERYCEDAEILRLAGVKANNTVLYGQGHSTGEPIREPGYLYFRGRGLNVEYWDGANFGTLLSGANGTRQEASLNFSWADLKTYEYAPALQRFSNYSMRFTGSIQPRFTETYTFHATADDGVRVWVNNNLIIDQWLVQSAPVTSTGTVSLVAGQAVPIKVEYFRATGPGTLKLEWSSATQAREVVPTLRTFYGPASSLPSATPNHGAWSKASSIGAWLDTTSWTSGVTAFGTGNTATFTNDIAANQIISVNGDITIGGITISDDGAVPAVRTFSTSEDGLINLQPSSGAFSTISVREGQAVINVPLYGSQGLLKSNAGTLLLNADSVYPGTTRVEGGSLRVAGKFTSRRVELANNAVFELFSNSTLNFHSPNAAKTVVTGSGTFRKSGTGMVQLSADGQGCVISLQAGSLLDLTGGILRNGTFNNSDWTRNFSSLALGTGTILDVWNGGPIRVDALTGTGAVTNGLNGGTTSLTLGVANGSGTFSGTMRAVGLTVIKTGTGTQTLSGPAANMAGTTVNNGKLVVSGSGANALGTVSATGTGQLRLGWQLAANSTSTGANTFSAGSFAANANAVINVTLNPSASAVALNNVFWTQPRSWTVLTTTSTSGTIALGAVSPDPADRAASNYGTFAVQTVGTTTHLTWTPLPILTWRLQKFGANASNATIAGDLADPDRDGLANLIEFVIGGQPDPAVAGANSNHLSPTASIVGSDLVFTFRRSAVSLSQPGLAIKVEYGSGLTGWQTATAGTNGVTTAVTSGIEPGIDEVKVRIPRSLAQDAKFFVRLSVTMP
jgi:autotransporter-associated beta strand protein